MSTDLTRTETDRLAELEAKIEAGMETFVDVGLALAEIRENRLYRKTHGDFESYCRERWAMTRQHANRLIKAAGVVNGLEPIGSSRPPSRESHARALGSLPKSEQSGAWEEVERTAPKDKRTGEPVITQAHVEEVVEGRKAGRVNAGLNPDAVREVMRTGMSSEDAAQTLGVSTHIYRMARLVVALADDDTLGNSDATIAQRALERLETGVSPAYEMVNKLSQRQYGKSRQRNAGLEAATRQNLLRLEKAIISVVHVCRALSDVFVPAGIPDDWKRPHLADLNEARKMLGTFTASIKGENS